jgi:membrane associated rhomboid family serine protease
MPIRLTRTVKAFLIISFVAFVLQHTADQFFGTRFIQWLGLVPSMVKEHYTIWQLLTYSFLNHDVMQLFFNLMMLAFIGSELEAVWGALAFLRYYFFCSVSAGLFYLILQIGFLRGFGLDIPLIGASGAIYGLLAAYGLIFGERVLLFMMLFPMKAKHFVWVLGLLQLMTTLYSPGGAAVSFSLLGGMIAGVIYLWVKATIKVAHKDLFRPRLFGNRSRKKKSKHLKLIVNNEKDPERPDVDESEGDNPRTWH